MFERKPKEFQWKAETGSFLGFGKINKRYISLWQKNVTDVHHFWVILGRWIGHFLLQGVREWAEWALMSPWSQRVPIYCIMCDQYRKTGKNFFLVTFIWLFPISEMFLCWKLDNAKMKGPFWSSKLALSPGEMILNFQPHSYLSHFEMQACLRDILDLVLDRHNKASTTIN